MEKKQKKTGNAFMEMPHSLETERALLGCVLTDAKIQIEVVGAIKESDFYFDNHKTIYKAIERIVGDNKPLDMVTLIDSLEKEGTLEVAGGVDYVVGLTDILPSSANYQRYLEMVLRDSALRRLMKGSLDIIDKCNSDVEKNEAISFAEDVVYKISESVDTGEMVKIDKVLPDVMAKLDELAKDKSASKGIKTNYRGIDNLLNGLHKSDLIILAARPSVGKTSFAMNIVENVAKQGYACAVFSLEMSKEQLTQRLLCSVANVSMESVSKGRLGKSDWLKLAKAREIVSKMNLYISESSMSNTREIMSQCKRLKAKSSLDLVVIDYIQLMSSARAKAYDNRQQEISDISRNLKIMAKELNVPVLALSQLSRAVETRKGRPQLADLRESGAIEQDADIVMFIHRPDKNAKESDLASKKIQENVAEILVEKHRNGPTGMVKLYFKGECTKFINLGEDGEPEGEDTAPTAKVKLEGVEELPSQSENTDGDEEEIF